MLNNVRNIYATPLIRAFRQAPWRSQTQNAATLAVLLVAALVMGGLYLELASRAAVAGRDLQALEARKVELAHQNDELRAELARLRSVVRLANRARELGFMPATTQQIEYLSVPTYYTHVETAPPPRAEVPPPPPSATGNLTEWLGRQVHALSMMTGNTYTEGGWAGD
jgi:hypothetical protein